MKYALFLGCNIPARLKTYERSSRVILEKFGVDAIDIREFKCCGYPLQNFDFKAFVLSAARNLALSESHGLNIIVLCKCCFGSLKKADYFLRNNESLKEEVNETLSIEGLRFEGRLEIKHFLSVLYHDIGIKRIREHITRPFKDLKIAVHYGCHALRPSEIVRFDDPVAPTLFDRLVETTGAESIQWATKLECCGAPLLGVNDALSQDLATKKLVDGKKSGADFLCTACPYCQLQFETIAIRQPPEAMNNHYPPAVLFAVLLGLAMGMDKGLLTDQRDQGDVNAIEVFLE